MNHKTEPTASQSECTHGILRLRRMAVISLFSHWLQLLFPLSCSYLLFIKRECFCSCLLWNKPVRWSNQRKVTHGPWCGEKQRCCRKDLLTLGASSCPVWYTALKGLSGTQWACAERWWTGPGLLLLLSLPVSASSSPVLPTNHNWQGIHRTLSTPVDRRSCADLSQSGGMTRIKDWGGRKRTSASQSSQIRCFSVLKAVGFP